MTLHEDVAPSVTLAVLILGGTAMVSMALRIYTRVTRDIWGPEDWIMMVACIPLVAMTVVATFGSYYGIGATDETISRPGNATYVETAVFFFFIAEILYCITIILVKLSIAFMLNRIAGNRKVFIYTNYAIMTLCGSVNLGTLAYIVFRCQPIQAAWAADVLGQNEQCNPSMYLRDVYYLCSSVNIFTDWATALMPIGLLWNIQMSRNSKITVAGILGLGIFTSFSGLIRIKYTVNITRSHDYLYGLAYIVIWGYAEPALGMIVGNISTLRPLFRCILQLDSAPTELNTKSTLRRLRETMRPRPYSEFDYGHELAMSNGKTTPNILGGRNARIASFAGSDRDSHMEILDEGRIYVSKEVEIVCS